MAGAGRSNQADRTARKKLSDGASKQARQPESKQPGRPPQQGDTGRVTALASANTHAHIVMLVVYTHTEARTPRLQKVICCSLLGIDIVPSWRPRVTPSTSSDTKAGAPGRAPLSISFSPPHQTHSSWLPHRTAAHLTPAGTKALPPSTHAPAHTLCPHSTMHTCTLHTR